MKPQLPVDANVTIPKAVLAQAQRAEAMMRPPEPEAPEAAKEPPAAPEPQPQEQIQTQEQAQEQAQEQTQEQAQSRPEAAAQKQEGEGEGEENWERRYARMKGRFEKAEERNRQLAAEIDNLHRVISTLQSAPPPPPEQSFQAERLITPEEEADYGPEFLGVVEKKAREVVGPLQKQYETRIKQLEAQLSSVKTKTESFTRDQMLSHLAREVPNWREMNNDETFLDWLQEIDPFSGQQRHAMLKSAYERNDAMRVAAFFKGFLREETALAPQAQPDPAKPAKVPLESLAAPGRARPTASANAPADSKPVFTRAQIAAFYRDVNSGRFRGKEAEQKRIEGQIFAATAEGRVR